MVRLSPYSATPVLNLVLHRYQVVLDTVPRLFFSNLNLAMGALRTAAVRKCNQVEVLDGVSGMSYHSRGRLH